MAGDAPALQLPNGWTKLKVSQLITNRWLEIGDGYRAKNSEMAKAGLPFVRAGDVHGRVNTTGVDLLGEESLAYVGNKRSQPGDAVITTKGTIGRMAYVRPDDPTFIYSPQLCFWRSLNPRKIDSSWLYYALHSEEMRHQMSWSAAQTDMAPYISLSDQRSVFEITVPPIEDQIAIGGVLLSLDEKIDLNRQMAATLEEMARALFKSWFVDFDPVHAKSEGRDVGLPAEIAALFPDSFDDVGLPNGWKQSAVGQLFTVVAGNTPSTKQTGYWGGPHAWATPKDMSGLPGPLLTETDRSLTEQGFRVCSSGEIPEMSLLMSSRAPVGYLAFNALPVSINQGIAAFVAKKLSPYYAWAWCHENMRVIKSNANGSTFQEISKGVLRTIPMIEPSEAVHDAFVNVTEVAFSRLVGLSEETASLTSLRDGLLPQLISGELRVTDAASKIAVA